MSLVSEDSTTNRELLSQVADWRNDRAWEQFRGTYDPYLWRWCRRYGLTDDAIDEVIQLIWIELARRMTVFEYDPSRTFRGWLRRMCESRVINYLRLQRKRPLAGLDDPETIASREVIDSDAPEVDDDHPNRVVFEEGDSVQAAVRARVRPWTWDAFWLVAVYDWSVARTAKSLGISHASVYAARIRVARMLRDEWKRRSDGLNEDANSAPRGVP